MAKKVAPPKPTDKECIQSAVAGDYCYYLNGSNKPVFAEVKKVFVENDLFVLQVICQQEFKFLTLPHYYCAFDEKDLRGKKRSSLKEGSLNV